MNILSLYLNSDPIKMHKEISNDFSECLRQELERSMQKFLDEEFIGFIDDLRTKGEQVQKNGSYGREFATQYGNIRLSLSRDRFSLYKTSLLKPYSRTIDDFEGLIQTLYLKGLSQNDISMQIEEMTGHSMSRLTIAKIVNGMVSEAEKFKTRAIPDWPIVYLDGTYVPFKTLDASGSKYVVRECVEVAVGVTSTGSKMVLGYFVHPNEGKDS